MNCHHRLALLLLFIDQPERDGPNDRKHDRVVHAILQ
jgi:hypothetical protein